MASPRLPPLLGRLHSPFGRAIGALTAASMVLTSAGGLLAASAHASDLPRVLILPFAPIYETVRRDTTLKVGELVEGELKSSEQMQLVYFKDPPNAAPAKQPVSPGPKKDPAHLNEARDRIARADEQLKKLKFKQAVDELERAIALLEGQHPYIDFNQLVDAYLTLSVAHYRLGQESDGEKLLAQVVRLDPERKLDAERYPPVFLRAFDNVAKKTRAAPRGSIRVDPTSSGAVVYLDGRMVGNAPLLIKDVIKGTHYLRVVPAGADAWADKVELPPGDVVRVAPDLGVSGGPLAELTAMLSRNTIDDAVLARVVAIGDAVPADYVLIGGVHKEGDNVVVSSHLMRVANHKVCLLQRLVLDRGMLGANLEIYKLGADIANKVEIFGDEEKLPTKVARDALAPAGVATAPTLVVSASGRQPARSNGERVVRAAEERPVVTEEGPVAIAPVRKITANAEPEFMAEPLAPGEEAAKKKKNLTWIWVAAGAAAFVALGAGGYLWYDHESQPITGSATVHW